MVPLLVFPLFLSKAPGPDIATRVAVASNLAISGGKGPFLQPLGEWVDALKVVLFALIFGDCGKPSKSKKFHLWI